MPKQFGTKLPGDGGELADGAGGLGRVTGLVLREAEDLQQEKSSEQSRYSPCS